MADILSQDEIDALLDVVDDSDTYEKHRTLDEASIKDIGVVRFPGTKPDNLQTVELGNVGYIEYSQKYKGNKIQRFKVVQISESGNIAVLTDEILDSIKVKVSEIEDRFYKDTSVYELNHMKNTYLELMETFDKRYGLTPQEFLDKIKKMKEEYPEIWLCN